jgi:hypothetical protein
LSGSSRRGDHESSQLRSDQRANEDSRGLPPLVKPSSFERPRDSLFFRDEASYGNLKGDEYDIPEVVVRANSCSPSLSSDTDSENERYGLRFLRTSPARSKRQLFKENPAEALANQLALYRPPQDRDSTDTSSVSKGPASPPRIAPHHAFFIDEEPEVYFNGNARADNNGFMSKSGDDRPEATGNDGLGHEQPQEADPAATRPLAGSGPEITEVREKQEQEDAWERYSAQSYTKGTKKGLKTKEPRVSSQPPSIESDADQPFTTTLEGDPGNSNLNE